VRAHIEACSHALNRGEALDIESILRSSGWDTVDSPVDANLNVIATCAVIETIENEMIKRAKALSSLNRPLVITEKTVDCSPIHLIAEPCQQL